MSIKSLLQIILFLLIILILGGIYFLYFYSGPLKNNFSQNTEKNLLDQNLSNQDILSVDKIENQTSRNFSKKLENNLTKTNDSNNKKNNTNNSNTKKDNIKNDEKSNVTKEIEYISTNKNGDIFKILAKYGETNLKNNNILDLQDVSGTISSLKRSKIDIVSDYAKYDYYNQNSEFYGNVVINYDNKVITCENFDLNATDNIAVAYNNVIVKDESSLMKAQMITFNTVTKDIKINSKDKVKVLSN